MISDILSLVRKNEALSQALEAQRSSAADGTTDGAGVSSSGTKTDFGALLENALRLTEKQAAAGGKAAVSKAPALQGPAVRSDGTVVPSVGAGWPLDGSTGTAGAAKTVALPSGADRPARASGSARFRDGIDTDSPLYRQCQEFESIFVKQMLDAMRQTVDKSGMLDNGMGQDIFEDMLYDEYAKGMSKSANFGLADSMYRQLSGLPFRTINR